MTADTTRKTRTSRRGGFTLMEIMIVVALLAILTGYVLSGLRQQVHLGTLQQYLQQLDIQGSRIMQELTMQLRPAILPVWTDPDNDSEDKKAVFALLDDPANGFRSGQGWAWWTALNGGVDSIAFVVPVDAEGDLDVFDSANRMEVGQRRGDTVALDATFGSDANGNFIVTSPSSVVNVDPARLNNDAVGGAANIDGWPNALCGTPPATSAFSVIRYVPALLSDGKPVVIDEAIIEVDLNGNRALTSTFNIGRLQLVRVGGTHAVQPPVPGLPVVNNNVANQTIDLSADVVLREVNPAVPQPIFQLVEYSAGNIDGNGVVAPTAGDGALALLVKVNLFDPNGNQVLRARAPYQQFDALNRQFETVLTLRNMER